VSVLLYALVERPSFIDIFGPDEDCSFSYLARARYWPHAEAIFGTLPSGLRRGMTLVAAGSTPPESFLSALRPDLHRLVIVSGFWLSGLSRKSTRLHAHRAARVALAHLFAPIQSRDVLSDDDTDIP